MIDVLTSTNALKNVRLLVDALLRNEQCYRLADFA